MSIIEETHDRFREWEEACARKDAAIALLTAERDEAGRNCTRAMCELDQALRERDALKADRDEWHRVACEQLKTIEALKEVRSQLERALDTQRDDNTRLRVELNAKVYDVAPKDDQQFMIAAQHVELSELRAERDRLRAELSIVMRERRDALQRAWNVEKEVDRLRGELARADKALGSLGIKLSDAEAKLASDHCPTCMDNADRLGAALTQLRELREAVEAARDALIETRPDSVVLASLEAVLERHAASEKGSVVASRKPGSPKDPQAETPVEAVRRLQHDQPLDTDDPYTKLFVIAELRTAELRELREAAEAYLKWRHHGLASAYDEMAEQESFERLHAILAKLPKVPAMSDEKRITPEEVQNAITDAYARSHPPPKPYEGCDHDCDHVAEPVKASAALLDSWGTRDFVEGSEMHALAKALKPFEGK